MDMAGKRQEVTTRKREPVNLSLGREGEERCGSKKTCAMIYFSYRPLN